VLRTIPIGKYRISIGALIFCAGVTVWIGNMLLRTGGSGFAALTSSLYFLFFLVLVTSATRTMTIGRLAGFYCLGGAMMTAMYFIALEYTAMEGDRYFSRILFVPFMEETLKIAPVAFALWRWRNSRFWTLGASDVVLMAAASGAGFGLVEDAYIRLHTGSWEAPIGWLPVASITGDHLVGGHAIWTALAGGTLGLALLWRRLGKARYALAASGWVWSLLDHISNNYAAGLSIRHDDSLHDFLQTIGGNGYYTISFFVAAVALAIAADLYAVYVAIPMSVRTTAPLRFAPGAIGSWWTATLERRKLAYLTFRTRREPGRQRAQLLINGALMHQMLIRGPATTPALRERPAIALALPILGVLAGVKLCALFGIPLHCGLLDVGQNVDGSGADGGVCGAAGGSGWPGGKDPYPMIGGGSGYAGGAGNDGGKSGGGGGDGKPWWQSLIPSSWTNIPIGDFGHIDTTTGRVGVGGSVTTDSGWGVGASADVGASPGSASDGVVNVNVNTSINTPYGNISGPSGTSTIGINTQNVPVGSVMGGQGTQSGAWLNSFMNSNN